MSRVVIGLHGVAGSGKNTVAAMLGGFSEVYFAQPLYEALGVITGLPVELLRDREVKETVIAWIGKSPRQMLQTLGTDWGREMVCDRIWVEVASRRIERIRGNVVVTDVRFDNEAEMLKQRFGAAIWKVVRPGATTCVWHPSERGVSDHLIDQIIDNGGDLAALERAVGKALNATLKEYPPG